MNRTLISQASSQLLPTPNTPSWFDRQPLAFSAQPSTASTAYSCFTPVHYEPRYAYPLIVWLHGPQSNEEEIRQVMPLISVRNHLAIAPRGTRHVTGVRQAYSWGDSIDDICEAGQRVQDCIAIAQQRFHVHADRIFVAGHADGGTMAHRLGMEFPETFAGAISLGGQVPRGSRLLKNINQARQMPLLLSVSPTLESPTLEGDGLAEDVLAGNAFHGNGHPQEADYPTEQVMDDLRFLHSAGMSLSLRLYPAGDALTTVMFSDLNRWVMEQFCPTTAAVVS